MDEANMSAVSSSSDDRGHMPLFNMSAKREDNVRNEFNQFMLLCVV